jgi:uncharacterized lipoprotein
MGKGNNKLKISLVAGALSLGLLSGCGVDNNQLDNNMDEGDYTPVRFNNNNDVFDNDDNRNYIPAKDVDPTDVRFDPANNLEDRNNRMNMDDNDNELLKFNTDLNDRYDENGGLLNMDRLDRDVMDDRDGNMK